MHAVIKFCYLAEIAFSDEVTPEDVLAVAHKYGIDYLQEICEEYLAEMINKVNLPIRLKLARELEATVLQEGILHFVKNHFDEAIDTVKDELFKGNV